MRWLSKFGTNPEDGTELFKRMVFNCAIRNTDDHELNHGLVYDPVKGFVLSCAFDVVPQLKPHNIYQHALILGDSAAGTVENILSAHDSFGLTKPQAVSIASTIATAVQEQWKDIFYECGFGDEEIRRVEKYFLPLP